MLTTIFSSEEQQPLEEFFKAKNIRIKNEMSDDVRITSPTYPTKKQN
jgi:hypothetical protein